MILLQISDFQGYFVVNLNTTNTPILQSVIDRYEKKYIVDLLGSELAELFIADLANVSQDARFAVIQDEFYLSLNSCEYHSRGMVDFLTAAIYYHYVRDRQIRQTDNGTAVSINEAQTILSPAQAAREGEKKWNESLDTVAAIQWYCTTYAPATFPDDEDRLYPEYNGKCFEPRYYALL